MPIIKIEHVVSCSSEDPNHPAVNLTSAEHKSWKCKNAGEKQVCVVLQLEKETTLTSVDIGNENSAFIEVLVGRSSSPEVDFEVLLVASSFMSPLEARSGSIPNRVRMFAMDRLSKPAAEQKWDRVKVVCTQPFNKHVQYGLAFVTFNSVMTDDKPATATNKLGRFVVKVDGDEADSIRVGSLFARRKDIETQPLKGAAAIREASSPAVVMKNRPVNVAISEASPPPALVKHGPVNVAATETSSPAVLTKHKPMQTAKMAPQKQEVCHKNGTQKAKGQEQHNVKSQRKEAPVAKKPRLLGKPFGQLLEGVVLVISGYQNPLRGNLRTMALEMGASYKADWESSCTHLMRFLRPSSGAQNCTHSIGYCGCAFPNTPKFQQVWGKGHIVCKEWIEDCHSKRKRLPWRRFALDKRDKNKPESEDEISELLQDVPETFLQQESDEVSDVDERPPSGSDTEDEIERSLVDQMDDAQVSFVISNKKITSSKPVVTPDWVWACSDAGTLLSTKPYQFV